MAASAKQLDNGRAPRRGPHRWRRGRAGDCGLEQRGVDYIVCRRDEGLPASAFPELRDGASTERFQLVMPAFPTDWHGRVYLYRRRR